MVSARAGDDVRGMRAMAGLLLTAVLAAGATAPATATLAEETDEEYAERVCPDQPNTTCAPRYGVTTPGGGDSVSHKGWPKITGVLWKVDDNADRRMTGGGRNDELLGHHGDDVLDGGEGHDVLWGDWDPKQSGAQANRQVDKLLGGPGNDWLYSSHGRNTIRGGSGKDYVWAYYGRGTIDCGPGFDTLRVRLVNEYTYRNCERIKNFCAYGSKPGLQGGCYKPGERPRS